MSELGDILNTAQVAKHYETIQFLTSHPNVEYTLLQLDFLIPRGASLQRFPVAWREYMEAGSCSNHCIEVYHRPVDALGGSAAGDMGDVAVEVKTELVLVCRRPELHSLEELARLLQSPAMLPDTEGCVALHTGQVILQERLLKESQQRGLLYYFPDNYIKAREHRLAKGKRGFSGVGEALNAFLRSDEADALLGADGQIGQLELPAGVVAQSMLYTRRGVPVRSKNSIPTRFNVGERALVVVERAASANHGSPVPVSAPALRASLGLATGNAGGAAPLDVRVKASRSSGGGQRSFMDIRAQAKGRVTLSLFLDDRETIVPVEVMDEVVSMPGVMIGREPLPALPVPEDICVNDPALWGGGAPDADPKHAEPKRLGRGVAGATLSWWLSPSPAVLKVRDLTAPDGEIMAAASRAVWIPHQTDEVALRVVRKTLREQHAAETARRSRRKRSRARELRNCHMLHFGFDALVPFGGEPQDR
ncbi:uncharacterized protein Tco025E_02865 [Trypanosoma conorhini]|uniref:TFIIH basal transcription factor subunit n=1 Tax=Trypanosoma conorhini TaxID=83891 RepID=A0A422PZJ3_9TRYP|nr:uncharacterized protein Tco025E_02865 [Trypanosoma conorhini]RNF23171.1 hypothetical protein Tco025E_02865 [Trypanosoma conorhini]